MSSEPKNNGKSENEALRPQKINFSKKIQNDHFFQLRSATFVRIFDLDKVYRLTNPPGCDIFQLETYPEMDSNPNLNG